MWWGWWLTTLVLMLFLAWRKLGTLAPSAVIQWLLPPGVLSHKSARADLLVIVLNHALGVLLLAQLLFTGPEAATWATETLQSWTGTNTLGLEIGWAGRLLWTAAILLVIDASIFLAHDSLHKVPFLWAFHRMHHGKAVIRTDRGGQGRPRSPLAIRAVRGALSQRHRIAANPPFG